MHSGGFPFLVVPPRKRGSVWDTTLTGVLFLAQFHQSTPWLALSILCCCAGLAPRNNLTLYPFDQSMRCTEWEKIIPTILPLSWLGNWACVLLVQHATVPLLKKCLCGHCCHSELLPSFPHSPTIWQVRSLSQSQPVMAHLFSKLQVPPESP